MVQFQAAVLEDKRMIDLETNIHVITNLKALKTKYCLYQIKGLSKEHEEFEQNRQALIKKFRFEYRAPAAIIMNKGESYLALPDGTPEPPSYVQLVRVTARFEKIPETLMLDYEHPTPEMSPLRIEFLQFAVQGALFKNSQFWQPRAGDPFFERDGIDVGGIIVYRGYAVRVVALHSGNLGLCVDIQHKYVAKNPLPADLTPKRFQLYKSNRAIYHFGNRWYEIKLHDHTRLSITEQMIPDNGKDISLLQYLMEHVNKPLPREIVNLPPDSPAVTYMSGRNEIMNAAATLCYPVFDTSDQRLKSAHRQTILKPHIRRRNIAAFVKDHLASIRLSDTVVTANKDPIKIKKQIFLPPDLAFGNGTMISARGTPGATFVPIDQLGKYRRDLLFDPKVGPHATKPLDQQYLLLPQSVADTHGPAFLADLCRTMNNLYPQEVPYAPIIITYNDLVPKRYGEQGRSILASVNQYNPTPGFGIAMIHDTIDRHDRAHDQLAAMVMRKLRDQDLYVSVIHTVVTTEAYHLAPGASDYEPVPEKRGKLNGYLRNIAITKILLTNERWPFVLVTPLHSDITIAIDVLYHTASFTLIGKNGPDIRTVTRNSNQKERLSKAQVRQVLVEMLRQEAKSGRICDVKQIVIQRDGRLFAPERDGIKEAIAALKAERALSQDCNLNLMEIPESSAAPFRLFGIHTRLDGPERTYNPPIGSYFIMNEHDAYLCSTGQEYRHPGTTKPLHIRYLEGTMPFADLLEDVYSLTNLTWTRPEDCTREPITIKLGDIRLREHAGNYDPDALTYEQEPTEESEDKEVEAG